METPPGQAGEKAITLPHGLGDEERTAQEGPSSQEGVAIPLNRGAEPPVALLYVHQQHYVSD